MRWRSIEHEGIQLRRSRQRLSSSLISHRHITTSSVDCSMVGFSSPGDCGLSGTRIGMSLCICGVGKAFGPGMPLMCYLADGYYE
jgi:hypothetical protein